MTYKSSDNVKDRTFTEVMQAIGDGLDVLDHKAVFRIVKCIGLMSEYIKD